eukprot:scaffold54272_cov66-Phaeocystis_antarctica.AAC.3
MQHAESIAVERCIGQQQQQPGIDRALVVGVHKGADGRPTPPLCKEGRKAGRFFSHSLPTPLALFNRAGVYAGRRSTSRSLNSTYRHGDEGVSRSRGGSIAAKGRANDSVSPRQTQLARRAATWPELGANSEPSSRPACACPQGVPQCVRRASRVRRAPHAPLGAKHAQSGAVLPRELRLIARTTAATTAATAAAATTAAATAATTTTATVTTAAITAAAVTAAAVTAAAVTPRLALPWEDERHELNAPVGWQDRREPARRGAPADHTTAVVDGGVIAGVCTTAITTAVVWSAGAPVGPRCTTATTPQR